MVGDVLMGPDGRTHEVTSMTIRRGGWTVRFSDHIRLDHRECVHADSVADIVAEAAVVGYEAGVRGLRHVDLRDVCARLARLGRR